MTTNATYKFDGETSGMERAYKTGNKLVEDLIRTVASMTPAYQGADRAADGLLKKNGDLERAGSRLRAALISPQQEYANAIRTATQLLNNEEISEAQYAMAVDKATVALQEQDGTLKRVQDDTAKLTAAQAALAAQGAKLRASLVTPQSEYAAAIQRATQLLNAEEISEGEYAMAVDRATRELEEKDVAMQKVLRDADQIKARAITPEQAHATAIAAAKAALDKKVITQKEYNAELKYQDAQLAKSVTSHNELASSLFGVASRAAGVAAAYLSITSAIQGLVQENNRFNDSIQRTIDMTAAEELKLQIKGGLLPSQVESKMPQIQQALINTPVVGMAGGIQIQSQIESSGFNRQDIDNNQALEASLKIKAATNGFRQAPESITKATQAIAMFQKAMGNLVPTANDILGTGVNMTSLFKESEIEFNDLTQLAQQAATLSGFGLTETEMLGAYSTLRDQLGAEKGATGFRSFIGRLGAAGGSKERIKALHMIGMNPEDVDIAKGGDQFIPVAEKLLARLSKVSPEQRNVFLNEMFGEEGSAAANTILNRQNLSQIERRIGIQGDPTEFNQNIARYNGSREARTMRDGLITDFANRQIDKDRGGTTWKEFQAAQEAVLASMQANGQISSTGRAFAGYGQYLARGTQQFFGMAPPRIEDAMNQLPVGNPQSALEQARAANAASQQSVAELEALRANTEVIRQNTAAMQQLTQKPPVQVTIKKPATAPTKQPAAASLGRTQ